MQSWLERARATAPKRAIKRGSSDLPTLENLDAYGDFLRGLLAEDAAIGRRKLREAMKEKGFLVSEQTMRSWLDRYHEKRSRARLQRARLLRQHEAQLLREWSSRPAMTYTQLKEWLEQTLSKTCDKCTMRRFMQTPFSSMGCISIEAFRSNEYLHFLKDGL